jgi:hypothetical protein
MATRIYDDHSGALLEEYTDDRAGCGDNTLLEEITQTVGPYTVQEYAEDYARYTVGRHTYRVERDG